MSKCRQCDNEFVYKPRKIYCSPTCKRNAQKDRYRKPCSLCGQSKPSGKRRVCDECRLIIAEKERARGKARGSGLTRSEATRQVMAKRRGAKKVNEKGQYWCLDCQAYRSPKKFTTLKSGKIPARCRKCDSAKQHALRIQKVYGLTIEAYNLLLDWQGGVCYICQKPSHIRRLAVDHDHKSGKVRGLLCRRCNREILGHFANDQIEVFERAISYLQDPPLARVVRGINNNELHLKDSSRFCVKQGGEIRCE